MQHRAAPHRRRARPGRGGRTILDVAAGLAGKARADGLDPVAVGVVVPGVVDEAAGVAVWSANLGFRDVPLRDLLGERGSACRTALGHDVRAGGLAEARLGAGRGDAGTCSSWRSAPASPPRTWSTARPTPAPTAPPGEIGHIVVRPGGRALRLRRPRLPGGRRLGRRDRAAATPSCAGDAATRR